jgi:hypothetical protein
MVPTIGRIWYVLFERLLISEIPSPALIIEALCLPSW